MKETVFVRFPLPNIIKCDKMSSQKAVKVERLKCVDISQERRFG
jgi:hypothetical protein